MKKENTFEALNTLPEEKNDSFIICPLDCGGDDYCDTCDGICKPTAR